VFGDGEPLPLDRNAKARIMYLARCLMRKTEAGKHYGEITAKSFAVLEALLWCFHNAHSGLCFPSYEAIAAKAHCARSTVAEAIKALEAAGLLSWVNRIVRIRVAERDLLGRRVAGWKVIRTSNSYRFRDPGPAAQRDGLPGFGSKSEVRSGNQTQDSIKPSAAPARRPLDTENPLEAALLRLGKAMGAITETQAV
jgi:DNA-binding MarR family transcriptional regulator